jgi:hypothetical protein
MPIAYVTQEYKLGRWGIAVTGNHIGQFSLFGILQLVGRLDEGNCAVQALTLARMPLTICPN